MSPVSTVVIGGSAGALAPLRKIVSTLPRDFPAPVLVVLHLSPDFPSALPELLSRSGPLPARHAQHGERLLPGRIYVAPPDHHLLVGQEHLRLSRGPKENRSRPSIDVLFRSAAYTHRAGVIGVLLSGLLDDGTSGLWTIKRLGGRAIVQHPEDAEYEAMPLSAVQAVQVDHVVPMPHIGPTLQHLLQEASHPGEEESMNDDEWRQLQLEVGIASDDNAFEAGLLNQGSPSVFTCPECHGVLIRLKEGNGLRFRCHTGHAYTAASLQSELRTSVEASLWNALRTLEENVMLLEHLVKHHEEAGQTTRAEAYRQQAQHAQEKARRLRQDILQAEHFGQDPLPALEPGEQGSQL
jgi:two-component system chemotaxis response regulator CheB